MQRSVIRGLGWAVVGCLAAFVPGAHAVPEKPAGRPPTVEFAEKERRSCVTCHTAFGRPELNRAGEYYKERRTLEGYPGELPPQQDEPAAPRPAPRPDR